MLHSPKVETKGHSLPPNIKIELEAPAAKPNLSTNVVPALETSPSDNDEPERDRDGRFIVTQKFKVDAVEHLDSVPIRWPVPKVETAYVLDFTDKAGLLGNKKGNPKSLDAFLKAEDQDSWGGGSNGSTTQDTKVKVLGDLPTRCSSHQCNGALQCERFDVEVLDGYERNDGDDLAKMREIFECEQAQNQADGDTVLAMTDTG